MAHEAANVKWIPSTGLGLWRGEGEGVVKGVGGVFLCLFSICLMLFTQSALDTEG